MMEDESDVPTPMHKKFKEHLIEDEIAYFLLKFHCF